jgi:hypothetical protein
MRFINVTLVLVAILAVSGPLRAEDMSGESLKSLLTSSLTIKLGGFGEGYKGIVRLESDGTGSGSVTLDSGKKLDITGTWTIEGDHFCRKWKFNNYKKVCETWRKMGENKVEVLVNGKKVGVNSW